MEELHPGHDSAALVDARSNLSSGMVNRMSRTHNNIELANDSDEPTALQSAAIALAERTVIAAEINSGVRLANGELAGNSELPPAPTPFELLVASFTARESLNDAAFAAIEPSVAFAATMPAGPIKTAMTDAIDAQASAANAERNYLRIARGIVALLADADGIADCDTVERMMAAYPAPSTVNFTTTKVAGGKTTGPMAMTFISGTRVYQTGKTDGHIPAIADVVPGGLEYPIGSGLVYSPSAAAAKVRTEQTGQLGPVDDAHPWSINGNKFWAVALSK